MIAETGMWLFFSY